ncbi:hypothetical protein EVA_07569 [gut metagenome]|uniref:Uncharacterized protein n=1 Tax=gut metagenome TaxID=749906 RepID=J9GPI8_9ZZZZ
MAIFQSVQKFLSVLIPFIRIFSGRFNDDIFNRLCDGIVIRQNRRQWILHMLLRQWQLVMCQ